MTDQERIERLENKLKDVTSWWRAAEKQFSQKCKETKANQKTIERLEAKNAEFRARLEKTVELPVNVGDIVYCIRNCGTGGYRIGEYTVTEIVFKYDNQMRIKTSYGLFTCEEWTFGLDCFADRAEAEAHLKELKEKNND